MNNKKNSQVMKWLKEHWTLVVILLLCLCAAFIGWKLYNGSSLYDKLMNDYNAQAKAHKEEIVMIENINTALQKKLTSLQVEHENKIKQIEEDYQKKLSALAQNQYKSKKKILDNTKTNPTFMTDEITKMFGIPVYMPQQP